MARAEAGASLADARAAIDAAFAHDHAGGEEASTHTRLRVAGICCPSETPLIHAILDRRPGVRAVKVIIPTKTVLVEHAASTASAGSIVDALNAARLGASLASAGWGPSGSLDDSAPNAADLASCRAMFGESLPPQSVMASSVLLLVSLLHYVGGALDPLGWVALGAVAVGIPPVGARKAAGSLRNGVVDINTLVTLAVAGACALREFGEAAAVVALFGVSEWLEDRAMGRASAAMGAVLALRPHPRGDSPPRTSRPPPRTSPWARRCWFVPASWFPSTASSSAGTPPWTSPRSRARASPCRNAPGTRRTAAR